MHEACALKKTMIRTAQQGTHRQPHAVWHTNCDTDTDICACVHDKDTDDACMCQKPTGTSIAASSCENVATASEYMSHATERQKVLIGLGDCFESGLSLATATSECALISAWSIGVYRTHDKSRRSIVQHHAATT